MHDNLIGPHPGSNLIMMSLPPHERERVASQAEKVTLTLRDTLFDVDEFSEYVYFPVDSVVSLVRMLEDGMMIEVGIVGFEGMVCLESIMGRASQPFRGIVQAEGSAYRMRAESLLEEFRRGQTMQRNLLRFTHALLAQVSQTAVCNRVHSIEQRLARWLLYMHDRVMSDELQLTQEFLSYMLGARRAGVNEAVGVLKESGLLQHSRNRILIVDRAGLEKVACECYAMVRREYQLATGTQ